METDKEESLISENQTQELIKQEHGLYAMQLDKAVDHFVLKEGI